MMNMLPELLNTPELRIDRLLSPLFAVQFMSPGEEIFHVGDFRLKWYGLLIASAVLIGVNLSMRLAKTTQIRS